jgi:hypothetical protein
VTGKRSSAARHNDLIWPVALVVSVLIVGLVVIIVTGHKTDDLVRSVGAMFSIVGAGAGTAGWIRSTQAAKQTNGDLDDRMAAAVQTGITRGLQQASRAKASTANATVPGRSRRRGDEEDPPTRKMNRPSV